jgi:hypothetical protein
MKNHLIVLLAVLMPVVSTAQDMETAYPQRVRAGTLLSTCASSALTSADRERRAYCAAFISGVEEGVRQLETAGGVKATVCTSSWINFQALVNDYMNYAAEHRQRMGEPAAAVVIDALREAYPCTMTR